MGEREVFSKQDVLECFNRHGSTDSLNGLMKRNDSEVAFQE